MASLDSLTLEDAAKFAPAELLRRLQSMAGGLSRAEAVRRLARFGPNEYRAKKKINALRLFFGKFTNPLILLLLGAALLSGFLGSPIDAVIIVVIVVGSALIDFANTFKSEQAARKLQEKVRVTASVRRDGEVQERRLAEIVPGDICTLAAGDIVPADGVLVTAKDVFVNESTLTGEALPVEKSVHAPEARLVRMGTSVVSGEGEMAVVRTGSATEIGGIVAELGEAEEPTEFDKNLKDFSLFIFRVAIVLVLVIFAVNIFVERKNFLEILLFAVAIAVGLTPELLPMIVTANLSKGALNLSRHGVIVRRLASIHNLGSIDTFCTDKTGTLTEDKISLMKYVDIDGNSDDDVLLWGYLSSLYHTGIRGALDHAIKDFKKVPIAGWKKVDEIPFDFERRRDSVVAEKDGVRTLIVKGAPEEVLAVSGFYGPKAKKLSVAERATIAATYDALSKDGFRVLALAIREVDPKVKEYSKKDEEKLTFLGFLAFLDPPKKTVSETLKRMLAHHVDVKIVTGDNELVTRKVASEIGFEIKGVATADELRKWNDEEFKANVEKVNVFTRVTPEEKERIIKALRANGHVVGYMGDGVNDVLSLKAADIGISVNNAVDVAKETADIILLNKGLREVIEGVIEGRKTFANLFKYLMMAMSSNFGNMVSMPIASLVLPFLPMTPPQILLNNFLYDGSQFAIPFDHVEPDFLVRPKKFDLAFMKKFMLVFGPLSSLFDIATFAILWFAFGLRVHGFQTGWFLESIATQALVVNIIRNRQFARIRPSAVLLFSSLAAVIVAWLIPLTPLGPLFELVPLSAATLAALAGVVFCYLLAVEFIKKPFYQKWGSLIERS